MLLGGVICKPWDTAEQWARLNTEAGYRAVYFPLDYKADIKEIDGYTAAARDAGLVIAEVGAWSNPMSPDPAESRAAFEKCAGQLELADYVGAKCCVNIAGSCSARWDGPHKDNLTEKTFDRVVAMTRAILERAKPRRTFFTLEPMPWMYPDSADSYLALLEAVDNPRFGAHLDPVNMICSPRLYYGTGEFLRDFFARLGPYIKSCHAKDILVRKELTFHLDECCPGRGNLDYETFLACLNKLDPETPLMLEHMSRAEDYAKGAAFLRRVAAGLGIAL